MCIQVRACVHACPCVVVSVQERKSERENVCEIVLYISQLAYTQRGVWERSCECNVVRANASKSKMITNHINTHYLSCCICVCVCARDRERQKDSEQKSACVLCLSACTLYAKTFTHTAALWNISQLPTHRCMHAMHTLDACMLMHFILEHTLCLCFSVSIPLSLFKVLNSVCVSDFVYLCVCACGFIKTEREKEI
jgi:hypothetical protein